MMLKWSIVLLSLEPGEDGDADQRGKQGEYAGAEMSGSTTEKERGNGRDGEVTKFEVRGQWQHCSVARLNHREEDEQSRHMTSAAHVTKGARRNLRNRKNLLLLLRAVVVGKGRTYSASSVFGSDWLEIAASDAGSIAPSKASQLGWSRRRRHIRAWRKRGL